MTQEENQLGVAPAKKFSFDRFVDQNQRALLIAGAALILLAAGVWYYKMKYQPKQEAAANDAIFMAERYFGQDSLDLALNGDGNFSGMLDIAEEYSGTKAGTRAHYYAGVIMMRQKKYDEAIDHLKKVSFDDEMVGPLTLCLIGDCYVELKQLEEAGEYYLKGANAKINDFTTPYAHQKATRVYTELKEWDKVLKSLQIIKKDYSETRFAENVDKLIARAETASAQE